MVKKKERSKAFIRRLNKETIEPFTKDLLKADEKDFRQEVSAMFGELMRLIVEGVEWNSEQRNMIVEQMAKNTRAVQKNLDMAEANFRELEKHINDIEQAFAVYVIQNLEHLQGKRLTFKKRKQIASLVNLNWTKADNKTLNEQQPMTLH